MKKFKKILAASIAGILAAAALAGCGAKTVNVDELADKLATDGKYAETLQKMDSTVTLKRYGIDESSVEECRSYAGTRAVVDEVAVFKAADTAAVEEKVKAHLDAQTESYKSYRPEEVPKLDDAVLYTYNDTVIFCVSEDSDAAMKIITEYTK